jgi:hypothetical protein
MSPAGWYRRERTTLKVGVALCHPTEFFGGPGRLITLELQRAASRRPDARAERLAAMSEDSPLL